MSHTYSKAVNFKNTPKETFDTLLDQVKVIDINEYSEEAQDGFKGLVDYWNGEDSFRLAKKMLQNLNKIERLGL
tara:strand:+ start:61 stop:282 length:222 start_codon:yes stop_codon:yes gene_type:complete